VWLYTSLRTVKFIATIFPSVELYFNKIRDKLYPDKVIVESKIGTFEATPRDDSFLKSLPLFESYTQSWLDKADHRNIFIDIGANIGFYSMLAVNKKGYNAAIAFEPSPNSFERLQRNVKLSRADKKVNTFNKAIGDSNDTMNLVQNPIHTGGNTLTDESRNKSTVAVQVTPLSDLLERKGVEYEDISFIKIDVEGFEVNVLKGMKNVLNQLRQDSLIFIETREEDGNKEKVMGLLSNSGFKQIDSFGDNYLLKKEVDATD
jgi:FkbM family methyltransferase